MTYPGGQSQQYRRIELFAQFKCSPHHVLGFLAVGWLQAGDSSEFGKRPVILFILAGMHCRVVGGDDHQPALQAGHRSIHE
jgi:hypothetical protein